MIFNIHIKLNVVYSKFINKDMHYSVNFNICVKNLLFSIHTEEKTELFYISKPNLKTCLTGDVVP